MYQLPEYPLSIEEKNYIIHQRFTYGTPISEVAKKIGVDLVIIRKYESDYLKRLKGETK